MPYLIHFSLNNIATYVKLLIRYKKVVDFKNKIA